MTPAATLALTGDLPLEAGEEAVGSFEDLVVEHQGMVFSLAYHTLRNRCQAEDVAQEAFLRLAGRLGSLRSRRHVLFWLRQVTCRLCIDELRRRPGQAATSLDQVPEPCADPPCGDLLLEERLRRLVAELPGKARLAVVLCYQEGLQPAEIADLLKEPLPTVKSRLQRSLARLREALGRPEGGRP